MNIHTANKRSACDRCREQKLRCPRNDKNSVSCTRCLRAGAACVTSSSRPPGRPRAMGNPGASPSAAWRGQQSRQPSAGATVPLSRDLIATAEPSSWPDLNMDMVASSGLVPDTAALDASDMDPWAQLDVSSMFGVQIPDDSLLGYLNENGNLNSIREPDRADRLASLDISMHMDNTGDSVPDAPLFGNSGVDENYTEEERGTSEISTTSALVELSRMNECTARQLSEVNSYPWRSPQMEKYCSERSNSIAGNPIAQALQSTARFAVTLRRVVSSNLSSNESHPTTPIPTPSSDSGVSVSSAPKQTTTSETPMSFMGTPGHATLGTPVMLLILSNHLQLLQLWNTLLSRAYELLRRLPEEVFESFRAPSTFHVTGLPGMKGRLYGKLLIHIVQDQLSSLERLLALPPEYRLSSSSPTSQPNGIFSNPDFGQILKIAMRQPESTYENTGKELVEHLRDTIRNVLEVLGS